MKKFFLLIIILSFSFLAFTDDNDIFKAMQTEIDRAIKNLHIEGMEKPYFVSLRFQDKKFKTYFYAFGTLVETIELPNREVQALVRVNSPNLDNSNFNEGWGNESWNVVQNELPYQDDILALRHNFWIAIDEAYKNSLTTFSKKKGYLQKHPQEDYPPDFLPIKEKTELIVHPQKFDNINLLQNYAQKLSSFLKNYNFLTQGNVSATYNEIIQYYVDSEGNHHKRPDQYFIVKVDLEAYTDDWYVINQNISWASRNLNALPKIEEAISKITETLNYMQEIIKQKPLEDYSGPVVFMNEAAGKFFLDLLGYGISKTREKLSAEEEDFFSLFETKKGFLSRRINQRILPISFEAWDKPNIEKYDNSYLLGYMPVDDEGVKSKDIQIIKEGKLINLPMRRTAIKKYAEINGHARSSSNELPDSYITNLFIDDKEGLSETEFLNKIKEIASEEGIDEVLIIYKLKEKEITNPEDMIEFLSAGKRESLLSNPEIMYLYNVKTDEKKPVWGLEFSKVNENNLKDIIASSKNKNLYQYYSYYFPEPPVSVISPNIIVEQLNLVKTKKQMMMAPHLEMPNLLYRNGEKIF